MADTLTEYRVRLQRAGVGSTTEPLPYPHSIGLRTKLGGVPEWIQADETPSCSHCSQLMSFVGQIDSVEFSELDPDKGFVFGDAGMIYVFFCFDCLHTDSVVQYH